MKKQEFLETIKLINGDLDSMIKYEKPEITEDIDLFSNSCFTICIILKKDVSTKLPNINTSLFKINKDLIQIRDRKQEFEIIEYYEFSKPLPDSDLVILEIKRAKLIIRYRENIKNHYFKLISIISFINEYNLADKKISIDSITELYSIFTELESRLNI